VYLDRLEEDAKMDIDNTKVMELSSGRPEQASRKEHGIELAVFLFLILPSMALSFLAVRQGQLGFVLVAIATVLRDLGLLSLVLFFLWRNREPVARIGWTARNLWLEVVLGFVLFLPLAYATGLFERLLLRVGFTPPSTPAPSLFDVTGRSEAILAFILVSVVAITEETVFRGYLILRLRSVTRSTAAAVILSSVVFSIGHGYEGTLGVMTVGFMGLTFALVYVWRRSLVAPMIMHFLQDFISILLLPLMGMK
jgi:membrane protease YdiL (CAAX protease family)